MGADLLVVYFGLRYEIESGGDVEGLERRDDPRMSAARKAGLSTYWGRENDAGGYYLLVGTELGRFGVESRSRAELGEGELGNVAEQTRQKLHEAGLQGEPRFHFQLDSDC